MERIAAMGVKVVGKTEDFDGTKGGIWVSLEEGALASVDPGDESTIDKILALHGWFLEQYDGGTGMIWKVG